MQVLGIKTDLIKPGDDLADKLEKAMNDADLALQDGDILVVSESTLATAEGRLVYLEDVEPSPMARLMAERYEKDPREMQLILEESDQIVGGIPGVVDDGVNGLLAPFGDVAALADAAERLLADGVLADQMGERGRAKVAGQYSWNSVAERVHAHYGDILSRAG